MVVMNDMIKDSDMLPGERVKLLALKESKPILPLACIELEWGGLKGILKMGYFTM